MEIALTDVPEKLVDILESSDNKVKSSSAPFEENSPLAGVSKGQRKLSGHHLH